MDGDNGLVDELVRSYKDSIKNDVDSEWMDFNLSEMIYEIKNRYNKLITETTLTNKNAILGIYKNIKDGKYKDKKIRIADANYVYHQYLEYYNDMESFIKEIFSKLNKNEMNVDEKETFFVKLLETLDADFEYCKGLVTYKDESYADGIRNIETLISLNKIKDIFFDNIDKRMNVVNNEYGKDMNIRIMKTCVVLMINSVRGFINTEENIIRETLYAYDHINDQVPKNIISDDDKPFILID